MGWFRNLADKWIGEYNPETDWWMKDGPAPRTPNQHHQPLPTPVTVVTQDDIDHEHDTVDHEHNTVIDKSDERQASIDAVPQKSVDHELAVMNEERDQRWAAQDRKAMDIPEPSPTPTRPEPDTDWARSLGTYQDLAYRRGEKAAGRVMDEAAAQSHPGHYTDAPPWQRAQEMAHEPETEAPAPSIDPA